MLRHSNTSYSAFIPRRGWSVCCLTVLENGTSHQWKGCPSLLRRFRDNFRKAGISPVGMEFEDFVESTQVVEKPLEDTTLKPKSATRYTRYELNEMDDALFIAASQTFEQQALFTGDPLSVRGDTMYGLGDDISDELLVKASQEFEIKFGEELRRSSNCKLQPFVTVCNQTVTSVYC